MTSVLFKVKHPNFGGHSGALVPVIYLRSRFRNAGDAVADFPGNTEKKYVIYNFIILYIYILYTVDVMFMYIYMYMCIIYIHTFFSQPQGHKLPIVSGS